MRCRVGWGFKNMLWPPSQMAIRGRKSSAPAYSALRFRSAPFLELIPYRSGSAVETGVAALVRIAVAFYSPVSFGVPIEAEQVREFIEIGRALNPRIFVNFL